jgi:hypothetical protein
MEHTSTMPMANERRSTGYKSATIAGAIAMTADPPVPARSLITIKDGILGAKLHPINKALKNQHDKTMTGYRPYISLIGARNKGPRAYPIKSMAY